MMKLWLSSTHTNANDADFAPLERRFQAKKAYAAMKQSVRDLVSALPNAQGGLINLGKKFSMANEHNWALAAPELFAQTVRAWVEGKTLPVEIENL